MGAEEVVNSEGAASAMRGARSTCRWVELPLLEVLAVEENQLLENSDGLWRHMELTGRTESVLTGAGSAMLRCCITERKVASGVSVCSAFAQAVRHL